MQKAGYVDGRHFTEYVDTVKDLKRRGLLDQAAALLMRLIEATEAEDRSQRMGVAPWYYEQLAVIYHKQKRTDDEIGVLERFAKQRHAPGMGPAKLLSRLDKLKSRLNDQG